MKNVTKQKCKECANISESCALHSLLRQHVFEELLLVSEAAERVHALQDVRVDLLGRGQRPDGHLPRDGLLRLGLVLPRSAAGTKKTTSEWM